MDEEREEINNEKEKEEIKEKEEEEIKKEEKKEEDKKEEEENKNEEEKIEEKNEEEEKEEEKIEEKKEEVENKNEEEKKEEKEEEKIEKKEEIEEKKEEEVKEEEKEESEEEIKGEINIEELNGILERGNKKWIFPTAYSVLLIIQVIVFILTFIIPKGRYATIFYDNGKLIYTYANPDKGTVPLEASQTTLNNLNISMAIEDFEQGHIKKPIAVPDTYERIHGKKTNFFGLFKNPILGMIESADVSFCVMVLGGCLNVLVEMKALTNGMNSLTKILKGRGFLLLCIITILVSIGGTTFGMYEETLAFYPIFMPIFLKNGIDGMLGSMSMYSGSLIGTMFSTVNAFSVVIASYSAGISFSKGFWFRFAGLILGDILTCGYFYYYYRKVKSDETKSICYNIKKDLEEKFLKNEEIENEIIEDEEDEDEKKRIVNSNDEELLLKKEKDKKDKKTKNKENKFTIMQKVALLIFLMGFIVMIIGVVFLNWWFNQITSVFFIDGIILMILLREGEEKAIDIFAKGAGDFASVGIIIGLARGVNITLEKGLVSDTILHSLADTLGDMNKVIFGVVMVFVFMILGFLIQSTSGLAVLAMPIFAPLAENVGCSRTLIVNAYLFGQNLIGFISPTGLLLIILQITGVTYDLWIKFIWPYMICLLVYVIILIVINAIFIK